MVTEQKIWLPTEQKISMTTEQQNGGKKNLKVSEMKKK